MRPRRLVFAILVVLVLLGVVSLKTAREGAGTDEPPTAPPPGRWQLVGPPAADGIDEEELARLESLPYLAGGRPAAGRTGVVVHDADRAQPGLNLYVSGHGPEAILMTNDGKIRHRWRCPFERAFPDRRPTFDTGFFRRAQLLPNGELIALYQGGGLVKLTARSEPVWAVGRGFYNDFFVTEDGSILVIGKAIAVTEGLPGWYWVLEDFVQLLDAEGNPVERFSLLDLLLRSRYAGLLNPRRGHLDVLHSNTITQLDGSLAERSPIWSAGHLLVSMREADLIAVVGGQPREVVWARKGPWDGQHEPVLMDDGSLLVFDNAGADGATRVLRLDPLGDEILWDYRGPKDRPLRSPEAGSVARLPNGNTLITDSESGRAIEVDGEERVVWEFVSPHRAGVDHEFVATLFEVVRVPEDVCSGSGPDCFASSH